MLIVERWLIGACATDDFTASPSSTRDWRAAQAAQRRATDPTAWVTRRQLLEELDRPVLKPLPTQPYVVAEWRVRRVGIHYYYVDVEGRIYIVPIAARAARSKCGSPAASWRSSSRAKRIAMHMRSSGNGEHTTAADPMPSSHRRYVDWTIGRIRRDAALIRSATAALCDLILEQRPHPE